MIRRIDEAPPADSDANTAAVINNLSGNTAGARSDWIRVRKINCPPPLTWLTGRSRPSFAPYRPHRVALRRSSQPSRRSCARIPFGKRHPFAGQKSRRAKTFTTNSRTVHMRRPKVSITSGGSLLIGECRQGGKSATKAAAQRSENLL